MHWAPPIMVSAWPYQNGCKAPDWAYTLYSKVPRGRYSSTSGDIPVIVIEFLRYRRGEFQQAHYPSVFFLWASLKGSTTSFWTRCRRVGSISAGWFWKISVSANPANNRYWIAQMGLFWGDGKGTRENRTGYWLRWWMKTVNSCFGLKDRTTRGTTND